MEQFCPECGGLLLYDAPNKRYTCKSCGLYLTKDQLTEIRFRLRTPEESEKRKKQRQQSDYLEWWLSGKKE